MMHFLTSAQPTPFSFVIPHAVIRYISGQFRSELFQFCPLAALCTSQHHSGRTVQEAEKLGCPWCCAILLSKQLKQCVKEKHFSFKDKTRHHTRI